LWHERMRFQAHATRHRGLRGGALHLSCIQRRSFKRKHSHFVESDQKTALLRLNMFCLVHFYTFLPKKKWKMKLSVTLQPG
jgi:hypothetical protein